MKKHSFSLASTKPSSSSKPNLPKPSLGFTQEDNLRDDDRHEFLTEFVPSDPKRSINQTLQIPRMENTWNWKPKMRNLDLPTHHNNGDLKFEAEAPSAIADSDPNISYGLNLRNGDDGDGDGGNNRNRKALKGETFKNTESLLLQKFKEDLSNLPEEQSEDYNDVPVEGFGAALLRAYGWCEEKDKKEGVKVVRIVKKRGDREGLGFDRVRERGVNVGKVMRVVGGRHLGLKGKVVGKSGGEEESRSGGLRVVMKLLSSGEEVTVGGDEVAELGSLEEEMCLKKLEELRNGGKSREEERRRNSSNSSRDDGERRKDLTKDDNKRKREERRSVDENGGSEKRRHVTTHKDSSRGGGGGGGKEKGKDNKQSWLTNHIRVRIISKDFKGGKLYLKKGVVVDVVGPKVCDISIDDSKELIQGVHEDSLETALPRRGGPILILSGRHKGVYGNLMEKDLEKETGVVRDADNHELINVRLEQVAEFIGDPSDIGY